MTVRDLLTWGIKTLNEAKIEYPETDARFLLEAILDVNRSYFLLHWDEEVEGTKDLQYREWIMKRSTHYPLQYILGKQSFMEFDFYVNEHVLIPRQDTEVLVEEALKVVSSDMSVLDMCCGSGCIGLSVHKMSGASVTLADISKEALEVTNINVKRLHGDVTILESDLFTNIEGNFDMILSNPPYIRSDVIPTLMDDVKNYEPMLALDGKEDGLYFYRRIADEARMYLNEKGYLFFEIGYDQGEDLRKILVDLQYEDIQVIKDLAGLDRVVKARRG